MLRAAKQCSKAEGTMVPATLYHRFATGVIAAVLRLRATAWPYAQDDTEVTLLL